MVKSRYLLISFLLLLVIVIPAYAATTTLAASDITNNSVMLNGITSDIPCTAYFVYGRYSGINAYKTADIPLTVAGSVNTSVSGLPLIPDTTYYYELISRQPDGTKISGGEESFTVLSGSGIDSYPEYETRGENLIATDWSFESLLAIIPVPYTDLMGNIFWGIIFGGAFILLWSRTHTIIIPSLFGMISGGLMWNVMPAEWVSIGSAMFYVSIGGFLYGIIIGRKT